jgi:hypothetical protein
MAAKDAANCAKTSTLTTLEKQKISQYHNNLKKLSGVKVNELQVSEGFQNLFVAVLNVNLHFLIFSAGQNDFYMCERPVLNIAVGWVVFHLLILQVMDLNLCLPKS